MVEITGGVRVVKTIEELSVKKLKWQAMYT